MQIIKNKYKYKRHCRIILCLFLLLADYYIIPIVYSLPLNIIEKKNSLRKAPIRRGRKGLKKKGIGFVRTEFCDYLCGNSLIDQDDDNICTSPQLGHMTGKWIRRDFNCNWKKWYEKIDPLGQSKIYNNSNTKDSYSCSKRPNFMKSLVGSRHRFVPNNCKMLRFNPSHALEMINNGCTSPLIFLGDHRIKNLANSWKKLVGKGNDNDKAIVEYHRLKHFEPLTWLKTIPRVKTLVLTFPLFEDDGTNILSSHFKHNNEAYESKVERILSTIDKTSISKVIFFVSPKHHIIKSKCEANKKIDKESAIVVKDIWRKAFIKFSKTSFSILDVTSVSNTWAGAKPFIKNGKCIYCLPGLPDTWSHILFNILHKSHIKCQIENFEEVSKHVSLHEALYGAMEMPVDNK